MRPTRYAGVNEILRELSARLSSVLGNKVVGIYLHGSLAIGDFDEASSDVDFIVVVRDELTAAQVAEVRRMHADILALLHPYSRRLEGSYFPKALLNRTETVGVSPLWFLDGGTRTMSQSVCDNSWVVLWELHNRGIAVVGPDPKSLFGPVPAPTLRRATLSEMKAWRDTLVSSPSSLGRPWNQSFVVLTACRMLQTLESGQVHSKPEGARWGETALPRRWRPLIRAAMERGKRVEEAGAQPVDPSRVTETLAFVEFAVDKGESANGDQGR